MNTLWWMMTKQTRYSLVSTSAGWRHGRSSVSPRHHHRGGCLHRLKHIFCYFPNASGRAGATQVTCNVAVMEHTPGCQLETMKAVEKCVSVENSGGESCQVGRLVVKAYRSCCTVWRRPSLVRSLEVSIEGCGVYAGGERRGTKREYVLAPSEVWKIFCLLTSWLSFS